MEELAAGQKPGGAEERGEGSQFAYFSNCPLSFPSPPSASLGTCRSCPFFFMRAVPFPSALTLLSLCCLSVFPVLPASCMATVAAVAATNTVWAPLFSPWNTSREKGEGGEKRESQ